MTPLPFCHLPIHGAPRSRVGLKISDPAQKSRCNDLQNGNMLIALRARISSSPLADKKSLALDGSDGAAGFASSSRWTSSSCSSCSPRQGCKGGKVKPEAKAPFPKFGFV